MAAKVSCGVVLYRMKNKRLQVFLIHPGGPLFINKDEGYWGIPKGETDPGETDYLQTAQREFHEETGFPALPPFNELGYITQNSGKRVYAWASLYEKDDEPAVQSNLFPLELPKGSGKFQMVEEVDKGFFFFIPEALQKMKVTQHDLLTRLMNLLNYKE
jgi:predicted NUDIX family NTP pyrophosphohydrolase